MTCFVLLSLFVIYVLYFLTKAMTQRKLEQTTLIYVSWRNNFLFRKGSSKMAMFVDRRYAAIVTC